ncbi:MAG TPA: helix-turn-helix transcriptional regulator [Bacillales bacterium]|nr:helix-turn-helix transcriptional regulator [Bacillales bacterium]
MNIGEKIIKLREKKNWSQKELAHRAGLNPGVMNRIKTGERPLRAEQKD